MTTLSWKNQPATGEWNTAENWTPAGLPTEKAIFKATSRPTITFSATGQAGVDSIEFADNAPACTFIFGPSPSSTPALTITGLGIINHSRKQQSFIVAATSSGHNDPQLQFIHSASAGGDDMYYCAGPETVAGYGGGVISFCNNSTAGSASFKVWTGAAMPPKHSTVGGEVSFSDSTSADAARFTIYGTLGTDGDTFGNVVFHDTATAANATFTNVGGTVAGGDGGNTQFYVDSTAANGVFCNRGGTHSKANGGDVAFDGTSNGGHGYFHNYAARAADAYGGVTSFNNNWPDVNTQGASAGHGAYFNYGAREDELGGGGHIEFSAKYGSPTAANASFVNYGSTIESKSSAGHTIFSISLPNDNHYYPNADNATFWNHPGLSKTGAAGFTEFAVYNNKTNAGSISDNSQQDRTYPTAGSGTFINLGAYTSKAAGGYTVFSGMSSAENATLIAYGGTGGGYGGRIVFDGSSSGGTAKVQLFGNGELDISNHTTGVTIDALDLNGGIIGIALGTNVTRLTVKGDLSLRSSHVNFSFQEKDNGKFAFNSPYTILTNINLSGFTPDQFSGNFIQGVEPDFAIIGNDLQVTFLKK